VLVVSLINASALLFLLPCNHQADSALFELLLLIISRKPCAPALQIIHAKNANKLKALQSALYIDIYFLRKKGRKKRDYNLR